MSKKIIMVIAQDRYRDEELLEPKEVFEDNGYEVEVVSPEGGLCKGMLDAIIGTISLEEVEIDKHVKAFVVVGGANSPSLMNYPKLGELLKTVWSKEIILGAICLAPMIVASFGIIDNLHATVYKTEESLKMFEDHKITYFKEDVLVDENLVTANGPHAAKMFAEEILDML